MNPLPLTATARFQFHKDFPLDAGADLVPYLHQLGVSHLYASPILTAQPGSTHGYDIVDPTRINPELGGEPALDRLVERLRAHGMGLILDIVPNHMGVGGAANAWWLDVLEWGRASPYAEFFDIDWNPPDATLRGRMLAPFLGSAYGDVLDAGELVLRFDAEQGRLYLDYFDNRFPIHPRDYEGVLMTEGGALELPARMAGDLPASGPELQRAAAALRAELRRPEYADPLRELLAGYNAPAPIGRERLARLVETQNYRLAWWRAASDEINWRRFFDVNQLAGIRAELPVVFEATHALILRLYETGRIDGVRIDHVDGLAHPRAYCRKLHRRLAAAATRRPAGLPDVPAILWVEKILAPHERMPTDWLTDGTTGYDFMNDAAAVLHDPAGEPPLTALWTGLTGRPEEFDTEARAARRQILSDSLSSELFATAVALHRIARRDSHTRDATLTAIHRVLTELLVHFRVYRIYAGRGGMSESDRIAMDWAMAGARRSVRAVDRHLLELIGAWLAGDGLRELHGTRRRERLRAMVRFQQLSAPTAAKSVEDTAFYRYGRLLSRNEVGSEPEQFALTPSQFHAENRDRCRLFPRALLATATHDHKRGEDTRARLAVLSEIVPEWEAALGRWMRLNAPLRRDLGGPAPDAADEIMLYQTLVGAWPLDLSPDDAAGMASWHERVAAWQQKSLREAKRHSGWAVPNEEYEGACRDFLAGILDPERSARVAQEIAAFAARLAAPGAANGLAQMMLRLTSPGIPDLYQGTEFWDLSLVDPDNRRPVDFTARAQALEAAEPPAALLPHWRDGRIKQAILHRTLAFRARAHALFAEGGYAPLNAEGPRAAHVLAFSRGEPGRAAITIVTRLPAGAGMADRPHLPAGFWEGTTIPLARNGSVTRFRDVLRDTAPVAAGEAIELAQALADLPVALWEER